MKIKKIDGRENRYFRIAEIIMNKKVRYYDQIERVFTDNNDFECGCFGGWINKMRRKKYKMRRDAFYLVPKTLRAFRRVLRRMGRDDRNVGVEIWLCSRYEECSTLIGTVKRPKKKGKKSNAFYPRSNRPWIFYGEEWSMMHDDPQHVESVTGNASSVEAHGSQRGGAGVGEKN